MALEKSAWIFIIDTNTSVLINFDEKKSFFFSKKGGCLHICSHFNVPPTNNVVSFEQVGTVHVALSILVV